MHIKKTKDSVVDFFRCDKKIRWCLLLAVTALFTIILYPGLVIPKHNYSPGDVAERDIKAPIGFSMEDKQTTAAKRQRAVDAVLTVYDHDVMLASRLSRQLRDAFAEFRSVIAAYKDSGNPSETVSVENPPSSGAAVKNRPTVHERIWQQKTRFEEKVGFTVSDGAYSILEKNGFAEKIASQINGISFQILRKGIVANKEILLRETEKGIILRNVKTRTERVAFNLNSFYGLDQAKTMVRIIGQPVLVDLNYTLRNLLVDLVQKLIQPNITLNRSETEERKLEAAKEVRPVFTRIKAGEMLLREGERVTEAQLLKLKALGAHIKKKRVLTSSLGAAMLILCLLMTTYTLHLSDPSQPARNHNKNLFFIASVLITFLFLAKISVSLSETLAQNMPFGISSSSMSFGIPLAAGAMTVCLFMGLEVAIPIAMVMAVCVAVIFQNKFEIFIYFMLSGTMGAYWLKDCRERKVFIKAGAKLGFLNAVLVTAINAYMPDFAGFKLVWDWAFAFGGGIGAGMVTAGIAPLVEIAFDYTTDIKLLELANLDRPILRRLMLESPGTYHHSVIVGSMVEAAASAIGANSLLAKVCGYYHDIGKLNKPLYFIENQANGKNRHDKLAPSMSGLILIAHVKKGVEIARENKLGQAIIDTIRQHHGTSLISFFYKKATQLKGEDAVKIDDFRYPGPKPQTREAGLVMLADVVEAASRTLENPTPSRIQGLVQNLINKVFSDGQLDDCELTLKDLHNIAKSFNKILNGIHHHRIEYSDNLPLINGKGKNGSPDRQPTRQVQDTPKENRAKGTGHLKRLGLS